MLAVASPVGSLTPVPPLPIRRFTVAEYHRRIETGILTRNDPVELLEGWLVSNRSGVAVQGSR